MFYYKYSHYYLKSVTSSALIYIRSLLTIQWQPNCITYTYLRCFTRKSKFNNIFITFENIGGGTSLILVIFLLDIKLQSSLCLPKM